MARLTDDRLATGEPILDRYLDKLRRDRFFSAFALERELADRWRLGYQELCGVVADLLATDEYQLVAAYYMENIGGDDTALSPAAPSTGVDPDLRPALARLYGADSYDAADLDQKRSEFWRNAFDADGGASLPCEEYEGPRFTAHDAAGNEHVLTPVYRCRTDGAGRQAGEGYEAGDLITLLSTTGRTVRRDGPGRYALVESRTGEETLVTSRDPNAA